jgi:hypothetical protein
MRARALAVARLAAALTLGIAAAGASPAAQLFKCIERGRTVYQQQACPVSAEPVASAPHAASQAAPRAAPQAASHAAARASAVGEAAPARRLKPAAAPSSAPAARR